MILDQFFFIIPQL